MRGTLAMPLLDGIIKGVLLLSLQFVGFQISAVISKFARLYLFVAMVDSNVFVCLQASSQLCLTFWSIAISSSTLNLFVMLFLHLCLSGDMHCRCGQGKLVDGSIVSAVRDSSWRNYLFIVPGVVLRCGWFRSVMTMLCLRCTAMCFLVA